MHEKSGSAVRRRYFLAIAVSFAMAFTAEAVRAGVVSVTHGSGPDLRVPPSQPSGVNWYYGLGMPIQLDSTTGGLFANIRLEPSPYGDFEVGADLIMFNSLDNISSTTAVPVSRPSYETNPWTGTPSVTVKYPVLGGFVPRGAHLLNGSAHPFMGTGFGMSEVGFYPSDFTQPLPGRVGYQLELQQFTYDGSQFTAGSPIRMSTMAVGNTSWQITQPGISPAIFDGSDMLFAVNCSNVNGVARFTFGTNGWEPTSFVPVATTGFEPTLIRDVDGSLLYANRSSSTSVPIWRSTDGGNTWQSQFTASFPGRSHSPVVLNQAVDGTPYLTTNTASAEGGRNVLKIIPLNASRTGIEAAITLRDGPNEFGPSPNGRGWYIDHPIGNVLRLSDGNLHSVQTYRVADLGELQNLPTSSPYTGFYTEEVFSSGTPVYTRGIILVPEPSSALLLFLASVAFWGFRTAKLRH